MSESLSTNFGPKSIKFNQNCRRFLLNFAYVSGYAQKIVT